MVAYKAMELSTAEQTDFRAAHRSTVSDRNFGRNTSVYRRDCGLIRLILLRTNVQLRGRNCDCIYVGSRSLIIGWPDFVICLWLLSVCVYHVE